MRLPRLAVLPWLLLGLAGCGSGAVAADDVAEQAEDALERQIGIRPDIACPEDLAAEEGTEMRCTLTAGDDPTEYGVTVTVTSVEGDTVDFDVQVDEEAGG